MNVLVDTNILTRIANPDQREHHDLAERAYKALRTNGHRPCVVPQSIYEFWSVASRPRSANGLEFSSPDVRSEVDSILSHFVMLRDDRTIFARWLDLVTTYQVRGKPTHDARLVAAMLAHGITHLLSFNVTDFQRYEEIAAVHPRDVIDGNGLAPAN